MLLKHHTVKMEVMEIKKKKKILVHPPLADLLSQPTLKQSVQREKEPTFSKPIFFTHIITINSKHAQMFSKDNTVYKQD